MTHTIFAVLQRNDEGLTECLEIVDKYERSVKTLSILYKVWLILSNISECKVANIVFWSNVFTQSIAFCEILKQYNVQSWYAEIVNTVNNHQSIIVVVIVELQIKHA